MSKDTYTGIWWSSGCIDNPISGTLQIIENSGELTLNIHRDSYSSSRVESFKDSTLYGKTINNDYVQLIDCFIASSGGTMEFEKIKIVANVVLIGGEISPENDKPYTEAVMEWNALNNWFLDSRIISDNLSHTYRGEHKEPIEILLDSGTLIEFKLSFKNEGGRGRSGTEIILSDTVWVTIKSKQSEKFDFYWYELKKLQDFFMFCTRRYCYPDKVRLWGDIQSKLVDGSHRDSCVELKTTEFLKDKNDLHKFDNLSLLSHKLS